MRVAYGFLKPNIILHNPNVVFDWSFNCPLDVDHTSGKTWPGSVEVKHIFKELGLSGWIFCGKDDVTYCFYKEF